MLRKIILHLLLLIVALPLASPQSGTLVSSFGDNGISRIDFDQTGTASDVATIIKFDSEGRIIVCGTTSNGTGSAILRLNHDNSPDSTFGENGKLIFQNSDIKNVLVNSNNKILLVLFSGGYDANIVIKQLNSDGSSDSTYVSHGELLIKNFYYIASYVDKNKKFLLLGNSYVGDTNYFNIIRFNSDGSCDNTYGTDGKIVIPLLWPVDASLLLANDKLLIVGKLDYEINYKDLIIMRLNADGSMDSTFNINGKLIIQNTNFDHAPLVADIDPNGRILIGGGLSDSTVFMALHIVRLNDNGTLDTTLQGTGKLIVPEISGFINSIQFDSKGKILAGEYDNLSLKILKLNDNGSIDTAFGANGNISLLRMNDFVLDLNDKILLAGNTEIYGFYDYNPDLKREGDFKIIRLDSKGATDSTFADSGELVIPIGNGYDEAQCMAFDANGKIILAGYSLIEGYNRESSIARINADGSMDSTFSGNGKEIFTGGEFDDCIVDIKKDIHGRILIVGKIYDPQLGSQYGYVKRLKSDGSIDSSFNPGVFNSQSYAYENVITFPHNDKILLAYRSGDTGNHGIMRLNEDGHVDSTFNQNGIIYPLNYFSFNLTTNADDQIITAGSRWLNNHTNFEIIRFNYDGSIDSTFNGTGKQIITDAFDYPFPYPNKIIIDKKNKILVTGFSGDEYNLKITLARLNTDGGLDSTFGNGGILIKPGFSVHRSPIPTFSVISVNKIFLSCSRSLGTGFNIESMNPDGSADTTFGHLGKIMISDGYCYTLMADSNYIWMAGSGEWDYKILKLYARNNQHIVFNLADTFQYGDLRLKLNGIASSGLPVAYVSNNPDIALVSHDTLKITGPGTVTVTARQGGDCSFYAADPVIRNLVVKSNITGIPTNEIDKEIRTYPNPVSGILYLESTGKIKSVVLTGLEGNVIYKNRMVNDRYLAIDLSEFKPGCYLITVQLDDNTPSCIRKIIKL